MTIEAGLEAIAKMGEGLTKAVEENTKNPGMFAVVERLIKALDRNTNTMLTVHGIEKTPDGAEAPKGDAGEIPANLKRTKTTDKPAEAKKPEAKKADAKPKIEYAQLSQKALDLMAKHGKPALVAFLQEYALTNLKQASVEDYPELDAKLGELIAKDVVEDLT